MKFFILLFTLIFITTHCEGCGSINVITNSYCFNNVLYFGDQDKKYRAGHFAINTKGDLIVEYSSNQYRLFYGLKKNGKFFFDNVTKEIEIQNEALSNTTRGRYESINSFVSRDTDLNKEKEYLLSISSYITVLELHDLEEDTFDVIEATNFFGNDEGIYSFIFQLLEIKYRETNLYLLVYISSQKGYGVFIKPFQFSNSNFNSFTTYNERLIVQSGNYRITSSFVLSTYNLIAIFYMYNNCID